MMDSMLCYVMLGYVMQCNAMQCDVLLLLLLLSDEKWVNAMRDDERWWEMRLARNGVQMSWIAGHLATGQEQEQEQ